LARAPDERYEEAYKLFRSGKKLIEIANQLNLPEGTVRRWKSTHKWGNERSVKKSERSKKSKNVSKPIAKEVKQVMENPELTDKQRLFCLYYVKCFNATKAYLKAYEGSYSVANVEGPKLLAKPSVRDEIYRLKQGRLNREFLSEEDIVQRYIDIAFADLTDFADFGTREVTYSNDEGMEATTEMSYVDAKPSWMVDGALLSEISMSKGGIKIKLLDQMKAMQWLSDHMDLLTSEQKARINHMQNSDKLDRERFEHQKEQDEKNNF
jgi:phage terminase small subunit